MLTTRRTPFRVAVVGVGAIVFAVTLSAWDAQATAGPDTPGRPVTTTPYAP